MRAWVARFAVITSMHHVRGILPNLVDKFSDAKSIVRAANHKIIKRLMLLTSPMQVWG